jgi:curved DNA-binding protein
MTNHYQTLGVDRNATPDEIKRAYRRLASQHHPDKGGNKTKFQEIEQAYRTLSDPNTRSQYDNPNPFGNMGAAGPHGFNFESIFDIFGARFQHQHHPQQRQQRAMMTLWITLRDAVVGGRKMVSVGTQQGTQTIEIEIPAGIDDGANVQYGGIAPNGMDLIITYRIHQDPKWARQGSNLQTKHIISVWDLILGCETEIRDIEGNNLSLVVPARTQPGTILRLRGRGITPRGGRPGDLLVQIQTQIPDAIPEELLAHINQIRGQ